MDIDKPDVDKSRYMDFNTCKERLDEAGFLRVVNFTAVHHLLKDFVDYNVLMSAFYIKPVGDSFLHVAVIMYTDERNTPRTMVKYTQAADDLLYGLRNKFREGDTGNTRATILKLYDMADFTELWKGEHYVAQRFNKEGRQKAKTRATLVMVRDLWKKFWTFGK